MCIAWAPVDAQQTPPAPTEQAQPAPQMPQDHPPLPEGHPQLPTGHPQLPQGHPQVSAEPAEPVVYETTEVQPAWTVVMRHLIVRPMDHQLFVTEVWAVNNPTDKSYIGAPSEASAEDAAVSEQVAASESDETHNSGRTTLVLPLPAGASHVQPGTGFHACCVRVEEGKIISAMPMLPGTTQMRVNYLLAPKDGVFDLALPTPTMTAHLMVFLPDDGAQVAARGLSAGDTFKAGDQSFRVFSGKQLEAGADVGLTIQATQAPTESTATLPGGGVPPSADPSSPIKLIAGIGAGVLLVAATFVLLKPSRKQAPVGVAG